MSGIAGGGAILTDDEEIANTIRKLRKHGENEILGYNSKMLLMNAVIINYRLTKLEEYRIKRQEVARKYDKLLKDLVIIQETNINLNHNYHKYIIRLNDKETRDKLKDRLKAKVHYDTPLSELPMYKNISHRKDGIANTQLVCDTILTPVSYTHLRAHET